MLATVWGRWLRREAAEHQPCMCKAIVVWTGDYRDWTVEYVCVTRERLSWSVWTADKASSCLESN